MVIDIKVKDTPIRITSTMHVRKNNIRIIDILFINSVKDKLEFRMLVYVSDSGNGNIIYMNSNINNFKLSDNFYSFFIHEECKEIHQKYMHKHWESNYKEFIFNLITIDDMLG